MSDLWITALTSAGAVGLLTAVFQAIVGRRKLSADAARVIEESASSAVQRGDAEIKRLLARLEKLEGTVETLQSTVGTLRDELRGRDRRIDDLSEELDDAIDHIRLLRDALLRQDPTLVLPLPPPRIARHFPT